MTTMNLMEKTWRFSNGDCGDNDVRSQASLATAVHSNDRSGIAAWSSGKIVIHLPSHHNTSYNNGGQDRYTRAGGTITNVVD